MRDIIIAAGVALILLGLFYLGLFSVANKP